MALKEDLQKALTELRKGKERKFDQTVDLIINLQKFDVKRTPINLFVSVPHKIKDKKIAAFLEAKNANVDTITPDQFKKYSDKKELKKMIRNYDFFIAQAKLMPKVAASFGRVLGPVGKMPSPQMGIIMGNVDDKTVNDLKLRINNTVKLKVQEASVKLAIGKQSMKDSDLVDNAISIYKALVKALPRDKENIKNVEVKFTMTKPQKIQIR
jgi:large subunit ribosomal protein L1